MPAEELSLGELVCLALVAEQPRHGWSLVKELSPDGELGRIWSLSRALTYRAVELLETKGLVSRGRPEPGQGASRVTLRATAAGKRRASKWLAEPVRHVRDLRTEFLLKATLIQRADGELGALVTAQRAALASVFASIEADATVTTPVGLWRRESARAAQRFLAAIEAAG